MRYEEIANFLLGISESTKQKYDFVGGDYNEKYTVFNFFIR